MAREINDNDKDLCSVLLLCSDFTPRSNNKYLLRHMFEVWAEHILKHPSTYLFPPASRLAQERVRDVMIVLFIRPVGGKEGHS